MILTQVPTNFTYAGRLMMAVSADLYGICERIPREVLHGERLRVIYQEGKTHPYVVMEECDDGVTRMVASYETLDRRVIDDLNRIVRQDINERLREVDRQIAREEHERAQALREHERHDRMMWAMEKAIRRGNLYDLNFSTSMPLQPQNPRAKTAPNG